MINTKMYVDIYFNSIKVRLEQGFFLFLKAITFTFQFHKGTIRTTLLQMHPRNRLIFQFHKGTIRTPLNLRRRCPQNLWVCECKDTKKSSEKCRCLKIFFLRPYDNLPIYGGFNKSKSTFGGFAELKTAK